MTLTEKSNPHRILHLLMILCAAGILVSAIVLLFNNREYAAGDAAYRQIRRQTQQSSAPTTGKPAVGKKQKEGASIDFLSLEKINPDVVAWLVAEGTALDYPVVQGKDNDYYLGHLFTGKPNKMGSIFMDYRNSGDFSDKNTIIYGHNMKNGSMFSTITKYKNQDYYNLHPTMLLHTPSGDFKIELFAGIILDGNNGAVQTNFKDDHDFQNYIDSLKKVSSFKSNTGVNADDRIITLCTCSYEFKNARYALFGKLTPIQKSLTQYPWHLQAMNC